MQSDPTALLKKHGKTFNFARFFLGEQTGLAAARLYSFCRIVDDIADESDDQQEAKKNLEALTIAIMENDKAHPIIGDFLLLCDEFGIDKNNGITLIQGVSQDLGLQTLDNQADLIQYAYKVAGVVGLMMAPILAADKRGFVFAVDLGIGMQLTNIARDVMEDAHMGRRYIPAQWLNELSPQDIVLSREQDRTTVQTAIAKLLRLAEEYYQSGLAGLYYLPNRNRRAIAVAAYSYREIGRKLQENNHQYWQGRVVVSAHQKVKLAGKVLWRLSTGKLAKFPTQHSVKLHTYLKQS